MKSGKGGNSGCRHRTLRLDHILLFPGHHITISCHGERPYRWLCLAMWGNPNKTTPFILLAQFNTLSHNRIGSWIGPIGRVSHSKQFLMNLEWGTVTKHERPKTFGYVCPQDLEQVLYPGDRNPPINHFVSTSSLMVRLWLFVLS